MGFDLDPTTYRNFELHFPWLAKDVNGYEVYSGFEIIITLNNGERILYDDLDKSVETLVPNVTESIWRRRFARRLYKQMRFKGIDQQMLSDRTGISRQMLSKYANAKAVPSVYNTEKIADALGCSVEDLLRFPK